MLKDPVEKEMQELLDFLGIPYRLGSEGGKHQLDFDCGKVFIEVKQFHTPRVSEQMARAPNVIAFQGIESIRFLRRYIEAKVHGTVAQD